MAKIIEQGDLAPAFTARTQSGEPISLADFLGKKTVVLFFYPADETPVCTKEACAFRDSYEVFQQHGAVVIGISNDSQESHQAFTSHHRLPFLLIADEQGKLRELYGVPKTLGILPGRVTYVIDSQGVVRLVFNSQLFAQRHIDESLKVVQLLHQEMKSSFSGGSV